MDKEYIAGLITHLEELGASSDVIDEVVAAMPQGWIKDALDAPTTDQNALVKEMILNEPDWRKRASMAAGIISRNLDGGY